MCCSILLGALSRGVTGQQEERVFRPECLEVLRRYLLGCMRAARPEPAYRQMYQGAIQLTFLVCKILAIIRVSGQMSPEIEHVLGKKLQLQVMYVQS